MRLHWTLKLLFTFVKCFLNYGVSNLWHQIWINLIGYFFNLSPIVSLLVSSITFVLMLLLCPREFILACWIPEAYQEPEPTARDYDAKYRKKLQEKAITMVTIVSCMTVGPPTVGKTTLREQIVDQHHQNQTQQHKRPLSTQVADKIKKFRLTTQNNKWNSLTSDEEITGLAQGFDYIKITKRKESSIRIFTIAFYIFILPIWIVYTFHYFTGNDLYKLKYLDRTHVVIVTIQSVLTFPAIYNNPFLNNFTNRTIDMMSKVIEKNILEWISPIHPFTPIIHFRDSGGQPEFHEVIPALMPKSTLYLIMFNLNEDLEKQYNVTYKASEEDTSTGYESSFTVKETILQILASIQSFHNHAKPGVTSSSALIIGTHRDKLKEGTSQLHQIQQELEKEIKGTDWYTSDAIATTPDGDLILPIDTYNYNDVETVKDMIKQSTATRSYMVPIPFLTLYFTIEILNKPVMSLNEFKDHARDCNITNELDNAIEYLQDIIGAIRYFRNIPEMKDIVITDPQILLDLVNELILCTFTFKNIRTMGSRSEAERFHSSGRFKKQSLQKCDIIKKGLLTADQVISILIHLSIIAPVGINNEGEEEYFLPCVLVHAPVSVLASTVAPGYSPLLITFKCGYTPRGVFSCLISSILCSREGQWVLASDKIYRNQVMFHLTEYGHYVLLKNCIKYLQVTITVCHGSTISDVPFPKIQEFLSQHLLIVITKLRYSAHKVGHSFGFHCTLEDHATSDPHIAQCIISIQNPHIKCTIGPSPMTASLTLEQAIWFKVSSKGQDKTNYSNTLRTSFDITHLSMVLRFLTKEHYDATTWQQLGLALGIYQPTLNKIESDARGKTEDCLRVCLSSWLRQEDNVKESGIPNWYTLAKALDSIGQRSIADLAYVKH